MCETHDPLKDDEEVCDAAYKVMEDHLTVKGDLEWAEELMNEWFENFIFPGKREAGNGVCVEGAVGESEELWAG